MLIQENGVWKKLVCPNCKTDNVCESGLGGVWRHCCNCFVISNQSDCQQVEVTSAEELAVLQQPPY